MVHHPVGMEYRFVRTIEQVFDKPISNPYGINHLNVCGLSTDIESLRDSYAGVSRHSIYHTPMLFYAVSEGNVIK
jgi:hypothetical protein